MRRYSFIELRLMAKKQGHRGWGGINKDELCKLVGVVRVEHEPKYILKNTKTGELTKWWSSHQMSLTLGINSGNIFHAIKKGKMLKVNGVNHEIEQVRKEEEEEDEEVEEEVEKEKEVEVEVEDEEKEEVHWWSHKCTPEDMEELNGSVFCSKCGVIETEGLVQCKTDWYIRPNKFLKTPKNKVVKKTKTKASTSRAEKLLNYLRLYKYNDNITETCSKIHQEFKEHTTIRGRLKKSVVFACFYYAHKVLDLPFDLDVALVVFPLTLSWPYRSLVFYSG